MDELTGELERASFLDFRGDDYPQICRSLILSLDNIKAPQRDGSITTLFISPEGALCGAFRPRDKPWTITLIPGENLPPPGGAAGAPKGLSKGPGEGA
jgi:hypothetical protein